MDLIDYDYDDRPEVEDATEIEWYGSLEDKPPIEQTLYKLQEQWYEEKDDKEKVKIWTEMFKNVQIYARSMVLQKLKNKKFLSPDVVDDYASDASLRFMSQYLYRRNFKCGTSFGKMINYKVLEAVYGEKEEEQTYSLYLDSNSDDTEFDLLSISQKADIKPLFSSEVDELEKLFENTYDDIIDGILEEAFAEVDSDIIKMKIMFYLNLLLKKPKNRHIKSQFIKMCCTSKKEIDVINLFELELANRLRKSIVY
jgi:hypothetical protein